MATSPLSLPKRILPSRSARRGGPGVGTCEADTMIIEQIRRQAKDEPLIPKDTQFFLTTDPVLAPSNVSSSLQINSGAYERYFERPEVIKAYREQQAIETPVFESTEGEGIVSRFRPRIGETQAVDTSDEAYLQRHRKYEKHEKSQRLREKEKLQHEQYKLHERVEQLRAMDYAAFLTLPASDFPPHPDGEVHEEDGQALLNGASIAEGERRRKAMLTVAESLEERYRILLPRRKTNTIATDGEIEDNNVSLVASTSTSNQIPQPHPDDRESEVEDKEEEGGDSNKQSLKLKIKLASKKKSQSGEPPARRGRPPKNKDMLQKGQNLPSTSQPGILPAVDALRVISTLHQPGTPPPEHPKSAVQPPLVNTPRIISSLPTPAVESPMFPEIAVLAPEFDQIQPDDIDQLVEAPPPHSTLELPASAINGELAQNRKLHPSSEDVYEPMDMSTPSMDIDELATTPAPEPPHAPHRPLKKRRKIVTLEEPETSASVPPFGITPIPIPAHDTVSAPTRRSVSRAPARPSSKTCGLVLAAQNLEHGGSRMRRQRHNLAWGFKIPVDVTAMEMDFELPLWLLRDDIFQLKYSEYAGVEEDPKFLKFAQQMNPLFKLDTKFTEGRRIPTPESEILIRALDMAHREHGEDSQSEDEVAERGKRRVI
ncbi:hypothetical protein BDP27DRAFT_1399240 [Rhodocollybia butyracea]|uniref:PEHE domain-containing protein n=1 Tax=Rhodocollybia butyracea TaxID=206335 RepID=A0A9P5PYD7_9AGAR|nr:hypothetical protein BDP27DRAFT_1399240 [Rhodocollybia butyracea]